MLADERCSWRKKKKKNNKWEGKKKHKEKHGEMLEAGFGGMWVKQRREKLREEEWGERGEEEA